MKVSYNWFLFSLFFQEKFRKLLDIHQRLGQSFDLISPTRELVKEGRVTKISARSGEKQERYLFLVSGHSISRVQLVTEKKL